MKLENLLTLRQIEEIYGIKTATIRSYIARKKVIPEDKKIKVGANWLIDKKFAEEKWGTNKKG